MDVYERRRIAFHEAGHALMAVHEGFKPGRIVVHYKGGSAETIAMLPGASVVDFVSSRARVLIAGVVAQCTALDPDNNQCVPQACERVDARDDWSKAKEHLVVLTHERIQQSDEPCDDPDEICQKISNELFCHVREILEQNRAVLDILAQEVLSLFNKLLSHHPDDLEAPTSLKLDKDRVVSLLQGIKKITPQPSS